MASICSVCGEKSAILESYPPICEGLPGTAICPACSGVIQRIGAGKEYAQAETECNYLLEMISSPRVSKSVAGYMEAALAPYKAAVMPKLERAKARSEDYRSLLLTSGYNFEGYAISQYLGFISSESVLGMGCFTAILASVSDLAGTESEALREKLANVKSIAMNDLKQQALKLGANAIIGMDLDYTMFCESIIGVVVSGTAVKILPDCHGSRDM